MTIPFQEKQDFKKRLKGNEVADFDVVQIIDEGQWVEDTWKDGTKTNGYWVKVKYKNQERDLKITRASFDSLAPVWGADTKAWVGQTALVFTQQLEKGKSILLKPKPKTAWEEEG